MVTTSSSISSSDGLPRFFRRVALFLPIIIAIPYINYKVDPAKVYQSKSYEKGMALILASGRNVANAGNNYDERLLKKYLIESVASAPDVGVIGSSRSMQVSSTSFNGADLINASVSGASVEDFLGLLYVFSHNGKLPKTVVLGLDPWLVNENSDKTRWTSIKDDAYRMLSILRLHPKSIKSPFISDRLFNLFSFSYLQASIKEWPRKTKEETPQYPFFATDSSEAGEGSIISKDHLIYPTSVSGLPLKDVNSAAINYAEAQTVYGLYGFSRIDKERLAILDSIVKYLSARQVRVLLFLPPYHPLAYARMMSRDDTKIIADVETAYRAIARKNGVILLGSFDPTRCGVKDADFFDGMHPKKSAVDRVFLTYSNND
jgi:hypothetical protein